MNPPDLTGGRTITFLYTDDLPRLSRFYEEVLGLACVVDQGRCRILRASPTALIGICDIPGRPRGTDGVLVSFAVEDLDAAHAALSARGVRFEGPVSLGMGGTVRSAFFRDPEGYRLEIQSFLQDGLPWLP
ncbi:VOC family protein [Roseomonas sp. SSH11]|uniref:VOC family protein n=1 Tax=Pararoseomonas baculiformis TaxID=2820812 RepID=A0ABS4AGR4_9PROT|nr:VOC family protein [Pararoseomonas baculiformis]MBP0446222.1 VOC family protein [Pararoseomonas baculiformis]